MSSLLERIRHYALTQPEKIALVGDTSRISYGALPALIEERIEILRGNGVRRSITNFLRV